jgi:hypothetical protein
LRYRNTSNIRCFTGELLMCLLTNNRSMVCSTGTDDFDKNKEYISIESLQPGQQTVEICFASGGLDFSLLLTKQVFKNEDDTVGGLYLACSDLNLSYQQITTIYKKTVGRRRISQIHQKQYRLCQITHKKHQNPNQSLCFIYCGLCKTRMAKTKNSQINHFAMKATIYLAAQKAAYTELKKLSTPTAA